MSPKVKVSVPKKKITKQSLSVERSNDGLNSSYSPSVSTQEKRTRVKKPKKMAIFSKLNSIVSQSLNL